MSSIDIIAKSGNRYLVIIDGDRWTSRVVYVTGREVFWSPGVKPVGSWTKMGGWGEIGKQEADLVKETILESLQGT